MAPRLVILGWDSATFDVIDPLLARDRLPALSSILERGTRAPLRSTWPPMTDCAWTSAFTGRNPAGHGIFGSWYRAPGAYECRYFSSRDRRAALLWNLAPDVRFGVWNVPMTYPPESINGGMVAGYGAPPGRAFCEPHDLQERVAEHWALEDVLDRAPHGSLERFRDDLLRGLEVQAEAVPWFARETGADCVVAVWPHVDRAQHFFWRFRGTDHALAEVVDEVYEAMDRATGTIVEAFPDADVMVVSDHGAGDLRGDVNLGAWLVGGGYAAYGGSRPSLLVDAAWALPPSIRRLGKRIAPALAERTVGKTLAGSLAPFDWTKTRAFFGFHSDLWLNLRGREPEGTVDPRDADRLLDELADALVALRDPATGDRVFAGAHRRDELFAGPAADLAPDLIVDSWSAGYRVAPGRGPSEQVVQRPTPLAGVQEAWSSDHRHLGIFAAAGPRIARAQPDELSLYDVCPTALALLEQPIPDDLDGEVAGAALEDGFLDRHPASYTAPAARGAPRAEDFSPDEAAAVAEHLKELGYIE